MHIELTEMLRCPEPHREEMLVLSTGEMKDRMVRSGLLGCPVCHNEYPISRGIVNFRRSKERVAKESSGPRPAYAPPSPLPSADAAKLQALLELSGPGGYVVLVGAAVRQATRLSALMQGIHFVGINPPGDLDEQPTLSLLYASEKVPLRTSVARGVVVGADLATSPWLVEVRDDENDREFAAIAVEHGIGDELVALDRQLDRLRRDVLAARRFEQLLLAVGDLQIAV